LTPRGRLVVEVFDCRGGGFDGDVEEGFSDDTVTWAELAVDTDRETGGRGTPRSEEERSEDEELLQSTSEYIDSLLMEYRVVDVAQ
jgi:hypothetical protein